MDGAVGVWDLGFGGEIVVIVLWAPRGSDLRCKVSRFVIIRTVEWMVG